VQVPLDTAQLNGSVLFYTNSDFSHLEVFALYKHKIHGVNSRPDDYADCWVELTLNEILEN